MYQVMIADDEPLMRKAMLTLTNWSDLDCEIVYVAENGQQVFDNIQEVRPDILITDIKMPGKDGIEIAKYIWEQKLPIKVIILTAYADFSYAQSAVKYDVVDYVTKTGAFDSLITSINKAKDMIRAERISEVKKGGEAVVEYFLKSVFDGSIYDESEIEQEVEKLGIEADNYLVMLLHFSLSEELSSEKRVRTYKSLFNFFSMVFGEQMLRGISVNRDMYAIVLKNVGESYQNTVSEQAGQIIDMMDKFMNLYVCIGISARHTQLMELKKAYEEAEWVLGDNFVGGGNKSVLFMNNDSYQEKYNPEIDKLLEESAHYISQGHKEKALLNFQKAIELQISGGISTNTIKNTGIILQQGCRKILGQYGTNIYHVMNIKGSITERINGCFYVDEYEKLMRDIIESTADYIESFSSRKKTLVSECEKFIEENYANGITVTDIAKHVGTSISYLSRIFKKATGENIINTLNKKRIEKAKEYLKDKDMKIYEIADALGFENATYFSYFFKKYTGLSPKDYK